MKILLFHSSLFHCHDLVHQGRDKSLLGILFVVGWSSDCFHRSYGRFRPSSFRTFLQDVSFLVAIETNAILHMIHILGIGHTVESGMGTGFPGLSSLRVNVHQFAKVFLGLRVVVVIDSRGGSIIQLVLLFLGCA